MHTTSDAAAPGAGVRAGLAAAAGGTTTATLLLAARAMLAAAQPEGTSPSVGLGAGVLLGLGVDELVGVAVVTTGAGACAVLTAGCLLLVAAGLAPGRWAPRLARWARRLTPAVLRRAVAVGLGAGLGLFGPAGVAGAAEIDLGWALTSEGDAPAAVAGDGALPDGAHPQDATVAPGHDVAQVIAAQPRAGAAALPGAPPATPPAAVAPAAGPTTVTVATGDSLWSIAAAHLPPDASDGQVAAAWPRWYDANRTLIGADPGLLLPGQVLLAPAATPVIP